MASNSSIASLSQKAQACLKLQVDIPGAPLWNMGKVAKFDSKSDFDYLQGSLRYLACKAKAKMVFNEADKEYLKEVYEAFYWGGYFKGYKEAAQLASHYVNGNGAEMRVNPQVYQSAPIVQKTMEAMKTFIRELKSKHQNFAMLKCNNTVFMSKPYAQALQRMNFRTEGKMKRQGVLEAPQDNHRLHKADGHFFLDAKTVSGQNNNMKTTWSVDSLYDFEPYEKHDYITEIPLGKFRLEISDGLSEYMTRIGVAKAFKYKAEWVEKWSI